MSDLLSSIKMLFENGWKFFTQTDIPGTSIALDLRHSNVLPK